PPTARGHRPPVPGLRLRPRPSPGIESPRVLKKSSSQEPQEVIQECLRRRDYPGAIRAFEALLRASPGSTQMRMRYADTLVLGGRGSDATREYLQVAEEMAESGALVRAVAIYKK